MNLAIKDEWIKKSISSKVKCMFKFQAIREKYL